MTSLLYFDRVFTVAHITYFKCTAILDQIKVLPTVAGSFLDPNDNAEFSSTKMVSSDPCFMAGQLRDHWVLISIFILKKTEASFCQTCQKN